MSGAATRKRCVTSQSSRMNTSHSYWALQACGGRALPVLFSLNPCVRGFIFTVVSKISGYTCLHSTGASIWFVIPFWKSCAWCAEEWNSGWVTNKKGLPSCKPFTSGGTQASAWLLLPICVDISNVNMNPVNFHTLVTASPVSVEASESAPPSWSCWESLDLWQTVPWTHTGVPDMGQWLHGSIKEGDEPGWGQIQPHQSVLSS